MLLQDQHALVGSFLMIPDGEGGDKGRMHYFLICAVCAGVKPKITCIRLVHYMYFSVKYSH